MMRRCHCRGFTLIELIAVMVIMMVVLFVAAGRVYFGQTEQNTQVEMVKAHLRYAQAKAMADTVKWGIKFNGSTYWLFQEGAEDAPVRMIGSDGPTVAFPAGMSHSGVYGFDDWGKPYRKTALGWTAHDGTALALGSGMGAVRLTKNTGFIP
jgi:MSHA pilin protein MshC